MCVFCVCLCVWAGVCVCVCVCFMSLVFNVVSVLHSIYYVATALPCPLPCLRCLRLTLRFWGFADGLRCLGAALFNCVFLLLLLFFVVVLVVVTNTCALHAHLWPSASHPLPSESIRAHLSPFCCCLCVTLTPLYTPHTTTPHPHRSTKPRTPTKPPENFISPNLLVQPHHFV